MQYSHEYLQYLQSDHWDGLRKAAYRKANLSCEHCQAIKVQIHAHHTIYRVPLSDGNLNDLLVLCDRCHGSWHDWRDRQSPGLTFDRDQTKAVLQKLIPVGPKKKQKLHRIKKAKARWHSTNGSKKTEKKRIFRMCRDIERRRIEERRKNDAELLHRSRLLNK